MNDTVGVDPVQGSFLNGEVFTGQLIYRMAIINYETTIDITGFDSLQVIENVTDIIDVCITMSLRRRHGNGTPMS